MNEHFYAYEYLSPRLKPPFEGFNGANSINEIRLRQGLPFSFTVGNRNICLDSSGRVSSPEKSIRCTKEDIDYALERICEGSVYRHMNTLCEGYIVSDQGLRIGIAGRGIYTENDITNIVDISSLNIRISRNILGYRVS